MHSGIPDLERYRSTLNEASNRRLDDWVKAQSYSGFAIQAKATAKPRLLRRAPPFVLPRCASKIGGEPYIESEADWPRYGRGESKCYSALAQINFSEFDGGAEDLLFALPPRGILSDLAPPGVDLRALRCPLLPRGERREGRGLANRACATALPRGRFQLRTASLLSSARRGYSRRHARGSRLRR